MKKSRRTYNGVHLNKKSNTQDVVEQSLTLFKSKYRKTVFRESARGNYTLRGEEWFEYRQMVHGDGQRKSE